MKLIKLFTRYENLPKIREELFHAGAPGLSVSEAQGIGKPLGQMSSVSDGRPTELPHFKRIISVELVTDDEQAEEIVDILAKTCCTSSQGDGKIFVLDVEEAVRVRTGERGSDAIY